MPSLSFSGRTEGTDAISVAEMADLPGVIDSDGLAVHAAGEAVPASAVVALARPSPEAAFCSVQSADGEYSASIPLEDLVRGGWLAFRLDGKALPEEKGGPIRLTVFQGETLCWNVKNVGQLHFTETKEPDSLPPRPTH